MTHNKNTILLIFSFLLLFNIPVSAKDNWIRVESKNFHLVGNASERDIKGVATKLEQFRETFKKLFQTANFDSAVPTNVIVFKSSSSYKPFKPRRANGKINENIAGYFQPGKDVNYITLSTDGEPADRYGTIFHEYVHFMLDINFGKSDIPAWFNEGLAEYYQTFAIEKDQEVKLGLPQSGHLMLLQQNQLIPLNTLFNISNYALHQNGNHSRSVFYAQSWALIHYLLMGAKQKHSEGLSKFVGALANGADPEKAFLDAFQINYAEMEKELRRYITQATYQYQYIKFKEKLVFDTEMRVSPLADDEFNSYLGDLLYRLRQNEDAEKYLNAALAVNPDSSMANNTLGMIRFREKKFAEAKKLLEKAINTGVKNDQAYYNYAYLLSREDRDEFGFVSHFPAETAKKMRDSLRKAIEINPSFTPSYELYAFVGLVNNEELDEAVDLLKKALKYKPGDQDVILRIAEIWSRQEKFSEAKTLAEKIAKTTDEEETKARADNLIQRINTAAEATARNNESRRQYEERLKEFEKNGGQVQMVRRTSPKTRELTPDELKIRQREESILAVNQALKPLSAGETRMIGSISKIACVSKSIVYTVKAENETLTLTSKDFQNLALVSFDDDSSDASVECNANLSKFKTVLTYKPLAEKSTHKGELLAIDFVPSYFKFMEEKDLTVFDGNLKSGNENVSVGLTEMNSDRSAQTTPGGNSEDKKHAGEK